MFEKFILPGKICLLSICISFYFSESTIAQAPDILWQESFGGYAYDLLNIVIETEDNGYLLCGTSRSNTSGNKTAPQYGADDFWIVKLDSNRNILWQQTYGGSEDDILYTALATPSNQFILVGSSDSPIGDTKTEANVGLDDYWIVCIDSIGNEVWQTTIGGTLSDVASSIVTSPDGGFLIGGSSYSNISGSKTENSYGVNDFWLVKISDTGTIEWQKTIGGNESEELRKMIVTQDQKYMVVGKSFSPLSGNKTVEKYGDADAYIVKVDQSGNILWQKNFGGSKVESGESIVQTENGDFIVACYAFSGASGIKTDANLGSNVLYSDYWILRLDSIGNILWQNVYGSTLTDKVNHIIELADENFIINGYSFSPAGFDKTQDAYGEADFWLIQIDASGNVIWDKTIGGVGGDATFHMVNHRKGGFIVCGKSDSGISGDKTSENIGDEDFWMVKLGEDSCITQFFYFDSDADGFGNDSDFISACESPDGYVLNNHDCNDFDETINPSIIETCNSLDDNCDGIIDNSIISTIVPSGATTFCAGSNVILSASPTGVGYTYQWKKNNVNLSGATASSYTASGTGNYQVVVNQSTCSGKSDSILISRIALPMATLTNVDTTNNLCFDSSIKLKANTGVGLSYQWYKGSTLIVGATSYGYYATTTGNYKVKVINASGCSKNSTPYTIINSCKQDFDKQNNQVRIYPNPASENIFIELESTWQIYEINIFNLLGNKIYTAQSVESFNILIDDLNTGLYLIEVIQNNRTLMNQILDVVK